MDEEVIEHCKRQGRDGADLFATLVVGQKVSESVAIGLALDMLKDWEDVLREKFAADDVPQLLFATVFSYVKRLEELGANMPAHVLPSEHKH